MGDAPSARAPWVSATVGDAPSPHERRLVVCHIVFDQLPALTVVLLCLVALVAGWIDAIVGGGGVIQLPAMLIAVPAQTPIATISGTNKLSSVVGTAMASATYLSKVRIHWPTTLIAVAFAYGGSTVGAHLIQFVPRDAFVPIMVVVVAVVGIYTWRRPQLGQSARTTAFGLRRAAIAAAVGLVCGLWDGVIGPGTGVFLVIAFVALLGYEFLEATTMAKVVNLATNIAALVVLGTSGHIIWMLGACMAACNMAGAAVGSRMAIKHGNEFIRTIFLVAVVIVEIRLIYETVRLLW